MTDLPAFLTLVTITGNLLAARLFGVNGIWASETVSELILCAVALLMLRHGQAKATLEWSVGSVSGRHDAEPGNPNLRDYFKPMLLNHVE